MTQQDSPKTLGCLGAAGVALVAVMMIGALTGQSWKKGDPAPTPSPTPSVSASVPPQLEGQP